MKIQFGKIVTASLAMAMVLSTGALAFADGAPSGNGSAEGQHHHHHMRKVFEACAKVNNITLPAQGSGDTLSSTDRETLHACVKTFHEDFKSCIQSAGITKPEPGQAPSAADKAAFKQCRTTALSEISASSASSN